MSMTATTKRQFACHFVLAACCIGFADGSAAPYGPMNATNSQSVRALVLDYLAKHGSEMGTRVPADYEIDVQQFGKSTWLVYAKRKNLAPDSTTLFIADKNGVREGSLQNLVYAHAAEFPESADEKDHRKIIESIVKLFSSRGHGRAATIISSTNEILGYGRSNHEPGRDQDDGRLDPDLERVVRPSWKEQRPSAGSLFYVLYTYNQIGGELSRYKFHFKATSRDANNSPNRWRVYTAQQITLGTRLCDFKLLH